ncbi:MAG: immune inhibitor A [Thermoplasmata archaeon]
MKLTKTASLAIVMLMVIGAFSAIVIPCSAAESPVPSIADVMKKDIGPEIRKAQPDEAAVSASASTVSYRTGSADYYDVGDKEFYYVDGYGTSNFIEFEKRGEGSLVEVWVATDLSFPAGDPRNDDPDKVTIYDWQVEYIINEFENVIYPIESVYFGTPAFHDGSNSMFELWGLPFFNDDDGKLMIMVWNMVDESYYDPTYPSYIAGYYSPVMEFYLDRNIIHIDSYDWANRIGPDVARPFVYESTVAHEYQHLLHDDLDADEVAFINEGCSMYAEMLCGYGEPWPYIARFLYTPDNSLTEWGDQGDINILADYGAAAMFTIYLNDHFGGADFISALAANELNGEESVTDTLADEGYADWDFDKVFEAWTLANLIHSDDFGDGWYNYVSLDLNDPRAGELTTLKIKPGMGFVTQSYAFQYTWTYDGYNTMTYLIGPYGTDYLKIQGNRVGQLPKLNFKFDGNDYYDPGWKLTTAPAVPGLSGMVWYSGASDLRDVAITATIDLTGMSSAVLTFDTYYSIESYWDFGFVQVSTDGGMTWTSLENEYTTYDIVIEGHPAIAANMPGLTGSWQGNMAFDLSAYAGSEIMLAFRYMTDWAYTEIGWFVDNIAINGVVVDNGDDVRSFESLLPPEEVDFSVIIYAPAYSNDEISLPYKMVRVSLADDTETGTINLAGFSGYRDIYIIVWPDSGPTNYRFGLLKA